MKNLIFCITLFGILIFLVSISYSFTSYSALCNYLIHIDGWSETKCTGMNLKTSAGEMVSASKSYTSDKKRMNVSVVCGMNAMSYWAPFQGQFEFNTNEQMIKTLNVKGRVVGVSFNKVDRSGLIIIPLIKNASMVSGVMIFEFSNMGWREALNFSKNFDWEAIKKLLFKGKE